GGQACGTVSAASRSCSQRSASMADLAALLEAAAERDGAVLVDGDGREQWLAGCWRAGALRTALAAYDGASLRGLLGPLDPVPVALPPDVRPAWYDCDTPEQLAAAERLL
ncbi:hypothetical protein AB0K37_38240, partial [Actinomadura sp. NPDC049753]